MLLLSVSLFLLTVVIVVIITVVIIIFSFVASETDVDKYGLCKSIPVAVSRTA